MSDANGQASLFDVPVDDLPHARTTDPGTSWAAARATENEEGTTSTLRPGSAKHAALEALAESPATAIEVERTTGKRGIWKRVSDLKNAELIESVDTRRDPLTNRDGLVWALTERGRVALGLLERGEQVRLST